MDVRRTEHPCKGDYVDAFVQKLELDESAIMEALLSDNSKFVAFIYQEELLRKFKLKTICQLSSFPMTSHNEHSVSREEVYLEALSRDGLTNASDEVSSFLCSVFAETEVIDKQISFQHHIRSVS